MQWQRHASVGGLLSLTARASNSILLAHLGASGPTCDAVHSTSVLVRAPCVVVLTEGRVRRGSGDLRLEPSDEPIEVGIVGRQIRHTLDECIGGGTAARGTTGRHDERGTGTVAAAAAAGCCLTGPLDVSALQRLSAKPHTAQRHNRARQQGKRREQEHSFDCSALAPQTPCPPSPPP
jgi:hypothetical protein